MSATSLKYIYIYASFETMVKLRYFEEEEEAHQVEGTSGLSVLKEAAKKLEQLVAPSTSEKPFHQQMTPTSVEELVNEAKQYMDGG